jgi:hypothetical protein
VAKGGNSVDTIYRLFRAEPGVLEVGNDKRIDRRKKKSIRIPHSIYVLGMNVIVPRRKPPDRFLYTFCTQR